jgi:LuxR family maltose regulon positive regulatory protein
LQKGASLLALTGEHGIYIFALVELARLRRAQGDEEEALALLKKANEHLPGRYLSSQYPVALARSLALPLPWASEKIDLGWTEEIESLAVGTTIVRAGNLRGLFYYATATSQMRALIRRRRQGEPVDAARWRQLQQLIEQWSRDAAESGWTERLIELSLLGALAHAASGAEEGALAALQKALQLAKPAGYIRLFVDEGAALAALLYRAAERGIEAEYAGELLSHFPRAAEGSKASSPGAAPGLVEPLSERELEVLAHIAEGMTNQEIAVELKIALSTVKAHARNIYSKLNVGNRTEAVARARELGLSL